MVKFLVTFTIVTITSLPSFCQTTFSLLFEDCHVSGSTTIFDYNKKKWITTDPNDRYLATLPASTFKIINSLIALETGVIKDENEFIRWPGTTDTTKYGLRPDIYHDMNIKEAFRKSAGWVYVELAKTIGKERYHEYLTKCGYGNNDFSIDDPDFWNFGNFAVSPTNQIETLIGVYEETLPFNNKSFKIVKEMMIDEVSENYIIRAKTGWTREGGNDTGWWIGYVERKDNVYFFATRIIKKREEHNPHFGKCRKEITRSILKELEILK